MCGKYLPWIWWHHRMDWVPRRHSSQKGESPVLQSMNILSLLPPHPPLVFFLPFPSLPVLLPGFYAHYATLSLLWWTAWEIFPPLGCFVYIFCHWEQRLTNTHSKQLNEFSPKLMNTSTSSWAEYQRNSKGKHALLNHKCGNSSCAAGAQFPRHLGWVTNRYSVQKEWCLLQFPLRAYSCVTSNSLQL